MHHITQLPKFIESYRQDMRAGTINMEEFHAKIARIHAIQRTQRKNEERRAQRIKHEEMDAAIIAHRELMAEPLRTKPFIVLHGYAPGGKRGAKPVREVAIRTHIPGQPDIIQIIYFTGIHPAEEIERSIQRVNESEQAGRDCMVMFVEEPYTTPSQAQKFVEKKLHEATKSILDTTGVQPTLICYGFWQVPHIVSRGFRWPGEVYTIYRCTRAEFPGSPSIPQLIQLYNIPDAGHNGSILHSVLSVEKIALAQTAAYAP